MFLGAMKALFLFLLLDKGWGVDLAALRILTKTNPTKTRAFSFLLERMAL